MLFLKWKWSPAETGDWSFAAYRSEHNKEIHLSSTLAYVDLGKLVKEKMEIKLDATINDLTT